VKAATSLRQGLEPIFRDLCGEDWDYDAFEASLAENLANGQHVLLVIASGLMDGLSRDLLQYVNLCLDIPLYGVEIDVFETAARQLIVPRGVRYTAQTQQWKQIAKHTNINAFLKACTPLAAAFFEQVLNQAADRDMVIYWGSKGFSVRMPLEPPVSVMYGFPPDEFQVYTNNWSLDAKGQVEFRRRLGEIAPFELGGQYTNHLHLDEKTEQQAYAALAFMWAEVEKMMAAAQGDE
jgi:hypothetical protein